MTLTAHPLPFRAGQLRRAQPDTPAGIPRLRSARRGLQLALAALWLLDAALQFQPYMFTQGFVTDTLAPTAQGNPAVIADPMRWVFHLMGSHAALFNSVFATIQLGIAAGLIWRRTAKLALAGSVVWAVGVWWFGEGLGGVLNGASPVMGAPGAVILYGLVAVLIWPRDDTGPTASVAGHGLTGPVGARIAWPILWGALAYLFLIPANRAPGALHDGVAAMTGGEPGWLAAIDRTLAAAVDGHGTAASITLAVACDLVAISIFSPRLARAGIIIAAAIGALLWVSEAFGGIFTGKGTDPNSGLLLVLVAAAFWPLSRPTPETVPADGHTAAPGTAAGHMPRLAARRRREPFVGVLLATIKSRRSPGPEPGRHLDPAKRSGSPEPAPTVRGSDLRIAFLAAVALLVSGCSAGLNSTQARQASQTAGASMPAGMHMAPGATMPAGTLPARRSGLDRRVDSRAFGVRPYGLLSGDTPRYRHRPGPASPAIAVGDMGR